AYRQSRRSRFQLSERLEQLLRFGLLADVAFSDNFLEYFPGAVAIAHLLIGLGQIKLRLHIVPSIIFSATIAFRSFRRQRLIELEIDIIKLETALHSGDRLGA